MKSLFDDSINYGDELELIFNESPETEEEFFSFDASDSNIEICKTNINILIDNINSYKSIVTAVITSCIQKMINPKQDIRLHRTEFKNGYSARSLDTKIITPFMKKHYQRYANKETAFLTLATREGIIWDKKNGKNLKIRNNKVKESFLIIIDMIEKQDVQPKFVISYIFRKLNILTKTQNSIYRKTTKTSNEFDVFNIDSVINILKQHFALRNSSRLPVIAIYSILEILIPVFKYYERKKLLHLNVHTSSDKHSFGDIEIYNFDDTPYEVFEIKHKISIDRNLINDVIKKTEDTTIKKYYILTTYENSFATKDEEVYVRKNILDIKKSKGIEIIPNGILPTIKYYLRFVDDYNNFVETYTKNLIIDSRNSTETSELHINEWHNILENFKNSNLNL